MTLAEALPELVADLEGALLRIGRGAVADQLRESTIERWTYDDFADAVYLHVLPPPPSDIARQGIPGADSGETIAAFDDVMVDLDNDKRLKSIEILGGRRIAERLAELTG